MGNLTTCAVLEATTGGWFNLLHLHGSDVMFDLLADYPVQAVNWHDRETPPTLQKALERFPGAVCGGLRQWETMVRGDPAAVRAEAERRRAPDRRQALYPGYRVRDAHRGADDPISGRPGWPWSKALTGNVDERATRRDRVGREAGAGSIRGRLSGVPLYPIPSLRGASWPLRRSFPPEWLGTMS